MRRHLSQLELSLEAEISSRHLSFIETARAQPSRQMLLKLARVLYIPLREQNLLLMAGGFSPAFSETPIDQLSTAREAIEQVLKGHEPNPAMVLDRHWNIVSANSAMTNLFDGIPERLLAPPINILHLSMHPEGFASRIVNADEWRGDVLERLRRQIDWTGDQKLVQLRDQLQAAFGPPPEPSTVPAIASPVRLRQGDHILSFISTTTVFGTASDINLSEITLECFYPMDDETRKALQKHRKQI